MIDKLTDADFQPLVGETVLFDQPDYRETLLLTGLQVAKADPPADMRRSFAVLFEGSNPGVMIQQGTYRLVFPHLGPLDLFFNCIGRLDNGAFRYQVVFS